MTRALDTITEEQRHSYWLAESGKRVAPNTPGWVLDIEVATEHFLPVRALMEVHLREPDGWIRAAWTREVVLSHRPHVESFVLGPLQSARSELWADTGMIVDMVTSPLRKAS